MVAGVSSGHPGGSLGVDFLTLLYFDLMNQFDKFSMEGKNGFFAFQWAFTCLV